MKPDPKNTWVFLGLTAAFLFLTVAFLWDLWGKPPEAEPLAMVDPSFYDPSPVRISAAELYRTDGDTSGFDCYACHDRGETIQLQFDENNEVIPPEDHDDLVFQHGRYRRNNDCFNCHHPENLDKLHIKNGKLLALQDSNALCASCHGTTYRDWEVGIHGRVSGFWDRTRGEAIRLDCTSCHDPHAPAFPSMAPAPGPNPLHLKDRKALMEALSHEN
jgi:hypothetical protein